MGRGRSPRPLRILFVVLSTALVAPACGTTCEQIAGDRARFLHREGGTPQPHLALEIPFAMANRLIAARLERVPATPITLGAGGRFQRYLPSLTLVPKRLELRPAPPGHLGLHAELELRTSGGRWLTVDVAGQLRPELRAGTGQLELGIRADDLRSLRPRLNPVAREQVIDFLVGRHLPVPLRLLLRSEAAGALLDQIVADATEKTYAALREHVLARLGEVVRLRIGVPDLPLADLRLHSAGGRSDGRLVVHARTPFPVSEGLAVTTPGERPPAPDVMRLRLAGATVAELGNWAIARGELPGRYDRQGRPTPDGDFEAGLAWTDGNRPLKVDLWKTAAPCLQVRLGATPKLAVAGDRLRVSVDDGAIERVKGPALIEFGAAFYRLAADAIRFSHELAGRLRFSLGGQEMVVRVRSARSSAEALVLDLQLHHAR